MNPFKDGLVAGRRQIGAWLSSGSVAVTEIFAGAGFDWMLIDMEHAPNDLVDVVDHLRAAGGRTEIMVRVPWNEPVLVKRLLDAGVRALMFPYVQSAEEAGRAVAATRYPPHGIRGVAGTSRATDFGRIPLSHELAASIAVVVQIETAGAVAKSSEIASVDGVDGVFIGPNDLAASMGHFGRPDHPDVRAAIADAVAAIRAAGKSPGTLAYEPASAASPFAEGFDFIAAGYDVSALVRAARDVLERWNKLRDLP